jgi:heme-binding protein
MLPSARPTRGAAVGAIGVGALAGAMFFGVVATAAAEPPPPPPPPPCTAAELALVMSGVSFDTSNYLTTHPDVNNFFTSLKGQPRDQVRDQGQSYLDANPQVRADLQAIRQQSVDFRNRCGFRKPPDRFGGVALLEQSGCCGRCGDH